MTKSKTAADQTNSAADNPGTAPEGFDGKTETAAAAPSKKKFEGFKVVKNVTLPLFKWENGVPKFLTFKGPIFQGKAIAETGAAAKKEPAFLAEVVDAETGELGQIIVATVLHKTLDEDYKDQAYIGKSFRILQRRIPGKNYNSFDITEIELTD